MNKVFARLTGCEITACRSEIPVWVVTASPSGCMIGVWQFSVTLLGFFNGMVLMHFGKYIELHFPGKNMSIAISLFGVGFFLSQTAAKSLCTDALWKGLALDQVRKVILLLSMYSTLLVGFTPILIEYQPYILLPALFSLLIGVIIGANSGMRVFILQEMRANILRFNVQPPPGSRAGLIWQWMFYVFLVAFALLIAPGVGSLCLDLKGSYAFAFYSCGLLSFLISIIACFIPLRGRKAHNDV